ncbi:MAG TPA: protoglobin domain-containing protein [Gemmataceae bacterium]
MDADDDPRGGERPASGCPDRRYRELQQYVGWTDDDARRVRSAADLLDPHLPALVDDFYATIDRHPAARRVLAGDPEQVARLKGTLLAWLRQLLRGPYDRDYVDGRWRVGRRHVQLGLDHGYVHAALSRLRRGLLRAVADVLAGDPARATRVGQSISTLIDLDLALVETAYRTEQTETVLRWAGGERRQQESILRLLLDTMTDGVLVVDAAGQVLLSNPALERMVGPARPGGGADDWPQRLKVFRPGSDRPCPAGELSLARALRGEKVEDAEQVVRCPERGADRWVSTSAGPLRDAAGVIRGAVVVVRDITERKRAEEQLRADERLLQSVLDHAPGRIAIKDRDGRLLLVNRRFAELAGRSIWDVVGRTDRCLFTGPGPDAVRANDRLALAGGGLMQFEEELDLPGGARTFLSVKVPAEGVGFPGKVLFEFTTDITDRKRAEERAVRSERLAAIGEMMTGLAHESGNALQRSQACLQMLAHRAAGRPDVLDLVDRVQAAQDHLLHLYEDVRGYAATLRLEPEPCDLAAVWRQAWANLEVQRKGRTAELREDLAAGAPACGSTRCRVDRFRLGQVFRNLFDNALAACPDPVEVTVAVADAVINDRPAVRVSVRDNGPGLTAEQQARMFEPFFTSKTKGTGLGLALARRIVEAHDGQIGPGALRPGCEIVITLPRGLEEGEE